MHFASDPGLAWGFYGHRLALYRATVPHAGFGILREWGLPTRVFTSNVDGQFQKAALPDVAECHGSIHHLQCVLDCGQPVWTADGVTIDVDEETMRATPPLPACPGCGALARPNILMFGDAAWVPDRTAEQMRAHRAWVREHRDELVVIEIGAGTAIPTVRREAEQASAATGALIRINVREPEVRHGRGVGIASPAAATLQALDERLGGRARLSVPGH